MVIKSMSYRYTYVCAAMEEDQLERMLITQ
jgi:hypothetical protein